MDYMIRYHQCDTFASKQQMDTGKKIFIVDDEPDIIEFLSYNFRKKGFDVFSANDGYSTLLALSSIKPDIMILDVMMPYMDGIGMCRHLKEDKRFKNIPVIFLSAIGGSDTIQAAMNAGGNHYETKPIKFPVLLSRVNQLLESSTIQK